MECGEGPVAPRVFSDETSEDRLRLCLGAAGGAIVLASLIIVVGDLLFLFALDPFSDDGEGLFSPGTLQLTAGAWEGSHISVFLSGETEQAIQTTDLTYLLRGADGMELYNGPAAEEQEFLGTTYSVSYHDRENDGLVSAGDWVVISSDPTNERAHGGSFRVLMELDLAIRLP